MVVLPPSRGRDSNLVSRIITAGPGRVRKIFTGLRCFIIKSHHNHTRKILTMVLSHMNFQLYILFEGPVALLTLDDNEVGDEGLHHLHWLLFDREVRTLLHRLHLDQEGGGRGWGRCGGQSHSWSEGFHRKGFGLRTSSGSGMRYRSWSWRSRGRACGLHWDRSWPGLRLGWEGSFGGGWDSFRSDETGAFLHVLLHVLGVAQLVILQVLPELVRVQEDNLLAEEAGVVDHVDDLPLGVATIAEFVLGVGERMFVGDMFPQAGEEVKSVADITEHTTRQQRVSTQLLRGLHFARLF